MISFYNDLSQKFIAVLFPTFIPAFFIMRHIYKNERHYKAEEGAKLYYMPSNSMLDINDDRPAAVPIPEGTEFVFQQSRINKCGCVNIKYGLHDGWIKLKEFDDATMCRQEETQ